MCLVLKFPTLIFTLFFYSNEMIAKFIRQYFLFAFGSSVKQFTDESSHFIRVINFNIKLISNILFLRIIERVYNNDNFFSKLFFLYFYYFFIFFFVLDIVLDIFPLYLDLLLYSFTKKQKK